jgi:hypothetical protein
MLKFFMVVLALICSFGLFKQRVDFQKRLVAYKNAAEWGCYQGYLSATNSVEDEIKRGEIREEGLIRCPVMAEGFKEFIRNGK